MKKGNKLTNRGFTLLELLIAVAAAGVIIVSVTMTFKSQHDSSIVQEHVTGMQQNLRAAIYMITRDIQMAGYYTNCVTSNYSMDWDDLGGNESIRPMIFGNDNINDGGGGDGVRDNSDIITIVKASDDGGTLAAGESASGTTITLADMDLDNDGEMDFDSGSLFGLLVKEDLNSADFFEIQNLSATSISTKNALSQAYEPGDRIFRADVIIYRVDDDPNNPSLDRKNLCQDNNYQAIAEDIDQLQFRYLINDGTNPPFWTNSPATNEWQSVRAVEVFVLARTHKPIKGYTNTNTYVMDNGGYPAGSPPNDPYRRKLLSSIVKTRNIR